MKVQTMKAFSVVMVLVLMITLLSTGCTPQQKPQPQRYGTTVDLGNRNDDNKMMDFFDGDYDVADRDSLPGNDMSYFSNPQYPMDVERNNKSVANRNSRARIESKVEEIANVDDATVIKNGKNCYVGIDSDSETNTANLENIRSLVENKVKAVDPSIDKVYVTTDQDGINKLRTYARDIDLGKPIRNFMNDIEQLF